MNAREKQTHANQLLQSQAGDPSQCVCGGPVKIYAQNYLQAPAE